MDLCEATQTNETLRKLMNKLVTTYYLIQGKQMRIIAGLCPHETLAQVPEIAKKNVKGCVTNTVLNIILKQVMIKQIGRQLVAKEVLGYCYNGRLYSLLKMNPNVKTLTDVSLTPNEILKIAAYYDGAVDVPTNQCSYM